MAKSQARYLALLKSLLPRGAAWNRDPDSILTQVLSALADEFSRIDGRGDDILLESYPGSTTELISEHEEDFGIPEEGRNLGSTLAERRADLSAKWVAVGQQDKGYFINVAEKLGYTVTITEYKPFWCGIGASGDSCGGLVNLFYWKVNVDIDGTEVGFDIGFDTGFPSLEKDDIDYIWTLVRSLDVIIFEINKIKPGHTIALYDFYNAGFSRGFSWGFKGFPYHDGTIPIQSFQSGFSNGFNSLGNYDGTYLTGGFDSGFNLAFDARFGGGFEYTPFSDGFQKEA